MRAAGWSRPNLAAIKSVKVDKKCSNEELFAAIRQIVSESVIQLRGTNTDDKYRNIVDMLMLRIRGALAETIEQLEDDTSSVDTSEIAQDVADATVELIESKINPENGLILVDPDALQQLANDIVDAINTANEKSDVVDNQSSTIETSSQQQTSKDNEDKNNGVKQTVNDKYANVQSQTTTSTSKATTSSADVSSQIVKISAQLDKNFQKIESLIQNAVTTTAATADDKTSSVDATQVKAAQSAVIVEKSISTANEKIQQKTNTLPQKDAKTTDNKNSKKKSNASDVLTSKQYTNLMNMLANMQYAVIDVVNMVAEKMADGFKKLNDQLKKMYDKVNKSKISWPVILLGVSLLLIPLLWNKITALFSKINEELKLDEKLNDFIKNTIENIDWNAHISIVMGKVMEALKACFTGIITNPFNAIIDDLKRIWDSCTKWADDIWKWVKGESKKNKDEQEENEKNSEQAVRDNIEKSLKELEEAINESCDNVKETNRAVCESTSNDLSKSTAAIREQVDNARQNATSQLISTNAAIAKNAAEISNTVIPNLEKSMSNTVNNASQSLEEKTNKAVSASESSLNGAIDEIDNKMKEDGPPTGVKNDTLDKMDAENPGTNISKSTFGEKTTIPAEVTTNQQQGKTAQLYTTKSEIDRAGAENKEVAQLMQNVDAGSANVTNVTVEGNTTQAKFESKVLVSGAGSVASEARLYEDMRTVTDVASQNFETVNNQIKESQKSLDDLKSKVNEYFSELNSIAKMIKDKPAAQQNSNVAFIGNGGGYSDGVFMEGV